MNGALFSDLSKDSELYQSFFELSSRGAQVDSEK